LNPTASSTRCRPQQAISRMGWARIVSGGVYPLHSAPRAQSGHGPPKATGRNSFSLLFFYRSQFLLFFVQFLSKFLRVFSIQIIPMKICFREFKSDRNFSVKYKVNEFFNSLFLLQIIKVIA
jgi:hypothetical protein